MTEKIWAERNCNQLWILHQRNYPHSTMLGLSAHHVSRVTTSSTRRLSWWPFHFKHKKGVVPELLATSKGCAARDACRWTDGEGCECCEGWSATSRPYSRFRSTSHPFLQHSHWFSAPIAPLNNSEWVPFNTVCKLQTLRDQCCYDPRRKQNGSILSEVSKCKEQPRG